MSAIHECLLCLVVDMVSAGSLTKEAASYRTACGTLDMVRKFGLGGIVGSLCVVHRAHYEGTCVETGKLPSIRRAMKGADS